MFLYTRWPINRCFGYNIVWAKNNFMNNQQSTILQSKHKHGFHSLSTSKFVCLLPQDTSRCNSSSPIDTFIYFIHLCMFLSAWFICNAQNSVDITNYIKRTNWSFEWRSWQGHIKVDKHFWSDSSNQTADLALLQNLWIKHLLREHLKCFWKIWCS